MKIVSRWLATLAIPVLALVLFVPAVYAISQMPHNFYGTVKINGHDAAAGMVIKAKFSGTVYGTYTTTANGQYGDTGTSEYLTVTGDSEDLREGDNLDFFVNDVDSGEDYGFVPGDITQLNLTASIPNYLAAYSNAAHTTFCDTFDDYDTEHTVYMLGTGLTTSHDYRVAYYDGGGTKRTTEDTTSDGPGELTSQHTFNPGTDTAGTWHVIICETANTPPTTYDSGWASTLASDSFNVETAAISNCFIATAAYGTDTAEEINILREFRDKALLPNSVGAEFVSSYYRFSPPIADFISRHDILRTVVREGFIEPIVGVVRWSHDLWSE